MTKQLPAPPSDRVRRWNGRGFILFGLVSVAVLVGGFGTWAATAQLAGAVIAPGQLRVTAKQQVVQHPDGGVVGEILVEEGDVVEGGQVLIRLDGTSMRSELAAMESQLFELMARRGRLMAEQAELDEITFDPELLERAGTDPEVATLVEGQRKLFEARRRTLQREMEVMEERQGQLREQVQGVVSEMTSVEEQADLIEDELADQTTLFEKGLARADRIASLKRERARLKGQAGQLQARQAQLKGQISELEIEKLRMVDARIEESVGQLREIGFRELELKEQRIRLRERLARLDIRAPRAGVIYDMQVFALKSVIRAAEPILYVVPVDTGLSIEARVEPASIDSIYVGQDAVLRFSAFNMRTTPEISGRITRISADIFTEERSGASYYKIDVEPLPGELDKLSAEQELVAGMPVDAFVQTGRRTPLNYMVKPITDYIERAWREPE